MEHNTYNFKSRDGLSLFAQSWIPQKSPKGSILLIHGLGEHCGRYSHVGSKFAEAGFELSAFDLRGHGRSEGMRGHMPSLDGTLDDIGRFFDINMSKNPDLPVFLYGHSLGGVLVFNYSMRRNKKIKGVIISAPSLRNEIENQKIKLAAVNLLAGILPTLTLPSGLEIQYLSKDDRVVRDYVDDPLVHDRASLSLAKNSIQAISNIFSYDEVFPYPLLVMHGSMDKISYPEGTSECVGNLRGNVEYKLWEGFYHELHNEPDNETVFSFIIDWLNKQL